MAKKNKSKIGFNVDSYDRISGESFDDYKKRLKELYEYEDALQEKNYAKRKKLEKEFNQKRKEEFKKWLNSKGYNSIDDINDSEDLKDAIELQKQIERTDKSISNMGTFEILSKSAEDAIGKIKGIYTTVKSLNNPWAKADDAASKFTKTIGGTKKAMDALRSDTIDVVSKGISTNFNMSMEELVKAQTDYVNGIGRNISVDSIAKESLAAIASFSRDTGINGLELASQFENFGVGIEKTGDHLGKMFSEASKSGINANKYAENVTKNIRIAQNYTFKDGLKGLENMAKKATAIKMDMQQVANFADKVSTVEGALETSAKLQVLGGPFASLADPMAMLNESLNDMEAFQDRQAKLFSKFGHFDKTTGEVTVSSFDKQRLKAYADASGQDISSIMESVHTGAKREEIKRQIENSSATSKFDKDMKELIMNTGVFKDGKVGINTPDGFKTLDQINPETDKDYLKQMTQNQSEDIKQIAIDLRSLVDKRSGVEKAYEAWQARVLAFLGHIENWALGFFDSGFGKAVLAIAAAASAFKLIPALINAIGGVKNFGSNIGDFISDAMDGSSNRIGGKKFRRLRKLVKAKNIIKSPGKWISKGVKGVGNLFKGSMSGAGNVIGSTGKGIGSIAKIGGNFLKGGGLAGAGLGIVGAIGNHYTDKAVEEGKMEVGGVGHKAAKAGSQALTGAGIGATIGSIIPGIGTAVGAAVGAVIGGGVGLYQASKAKNKKVLDEQLAAKGIEVKGDYSNGKLKDIDKALQDGKLSDSLRRKLIANGDMAIVTEIEKKKEEIDAKNEKKKEEKIKHKMNIGAANISIGVANIKGIGLGETFNPLSILKNSPASLDIKAVKEKGFVSHFDKSKDKVKENYYEEKQTIPKSFDININGTLKLEGNNGQSIDIINELRKNPQLLRSLADMISKEIGYLEKGTYVTQKSGK